MTGVSEQTEVVVERFIKAAPERIFAALTKPEQLERWFFTDVKSDPRPGGAYSAWWRSGTEGNSDHERYGKYLEFVPNERLVFEWCGIDKAGSCGDGAGGTVVTITLKAEAGGTRLRLVHSGWATTEAGQKSRTSHQGGWTFYMENLERYVTGGADLRESQIGQRVKPG